MGWMRSFGRQVQYRWIPNHAAAPEGATAVKSAVGMCGLSGSASPGGRLQGARRRRENFGFRQAKTAQNSPKMMAYARMNSNEMASRRFWGDLAPQRTELGSGVLSRIVVLAESGGCEWDLRRLVRVFSLARIFFSQKMRGRPPHLLGK